MSGPDPKRRFSRPELPISAIFNPRKLRRQSVSQLLNEQQQHGVSLSEQQQRQDSFDEYNLGGSTSSLYIRMANGPPSGSGPSGHQSNFSEGRRVHIGSASSGASASSVPLLTEMQAHGSGMMASFDGSYGPTQYSHPHQSQHQNTNSSSNPNTNSKPLSRALAAIRRAIFSKTARKLCCGLFLSFVVGCCWTALVHSLKRTFKTTFVFQDSMIAIPSSTSGGGFFSSNRNNDFGSTATIAINQPHVSNVYDAPFFTAWLMSISTILFYPIHQITVRCCSCLGRKGTQTMSRAVSDAIQGFRERGMTLWGFLKRCAGLCFLWLMTNWLFVASLRILRATEVLALLATTTSFVYLLSWVILHIQFVGVRIVAVILSNMGIALLAYMDGQTHKSPTVLYVIAAATAAAFSAVFKVSLKKFFGLGATVSQQVALIFSVMGLMSTLLLWPIFLTLYFTGVEVILWNYVPWHLIVLALSAFTIVELLQNFGVTCTFEFFIKIGASLIAIPLSAVLDIYFYNATFDDMRLGGIITIGIGCCVVLLPENWPDYITRLIRYVAQLKHHSRWGRRRPSSSHEPIDTRTGHIRSHLRSPSGRVR